MDQVRTVELGQFTDEHADAIAERLEAAGIVWWFKQAGRWSRVFFIGEWGTRLYVDATRLDDARRLAHEVLDDDTDAAS